MSSSLLSEVRIILVEPAGALNIGSVARVMKNMGLTQLFLVNPQCDPQGKEARQMAVHGRDILDNAHVTNTLPEALQGCHRAIATTARSRTRPIPLESPRVALPWLLGENRSSALIFGREDSGLTNVELNYAQRFVGIPANPDYSSLNLAQAVAVCAYELYQSSQELLDNIHCISRETLDIVSLDVLEGYYQHLETVLLTIGYLYPHTVTARMAKFRQLFNRANLSQEEVAMLRGILRQTEWAIQSSLKRQETD
jgi:tRNA/rRNA methyltransferase